MPACKKAYTNAQNIYACISPHEHTLLVLLLFSFCGLNIYKYIEFNNSMIELCQHQKAKQQQQQNNEIARVRVCMCVHYSVLM